MKTPPKIKICGLTRSEDVAYCNLYLPEYVGFVFAPSRREITPKYAGTLVQALDERILSVGVFVNSSLEDMIQVAKQVNLDILQLHGGESPEFLQALRQALPQVQLWKAHTITGLEGQHDAFSNYPADAHLVDAFSDSCMGGSGQSFNWSAAQHLYQTTFPLILAGGLTPENVKTALQYFNPYAVDVSSGVEENGIKNLDKIRRFIENVRHL